MSDHDQKDDWAPNQCTPFSCQVRLDINSTRECAIAAIKATVTEATHKGSGACGHAPFLRTLDALVDQAGGCVLTNESRLVPILLFQRKNNSKPVTLVQINPHAAECTIYLYPNLAGPGNTNAAKLSIIFENSFPAAVEFSENIRSLIWYVEDGIPLGLHAHESLLRASTFETHLPESEEQTQSIISALGEKIETLRRIRRLFEFCIKVFRWDIFFNGHDCYESGILTNIALQGGISCANLHKGEAGAVFRDTPPVEFCSQNGLMFSRVRTYIELRAFKAESPAPEGAALNAQREIFNRRLTDLNTLPYMKVNQDSVRGFSFFKDLTGAESLEEYSSNVVGAVTWLFCFHSFSDQAHYYGLDGFESHFQFFLLAAKTIAKF